MAVEVKVVEVVVVAAVEVKVEVEVQTCGWSTLPKNAPLLSTPSSLTWTSRLSSRASTKKRA